MILVTGATGLVGGHVLSQLCRERSDVRALVRTPERADALRGIDCEVAVGDYGDPASLAEALRGVDTVFLIAPGSARLAEQEGAVLDAIAAAGRPVRVVKLAAAGIDGGSGVRFVEQHQLVVDRLRAEGFVHTVVAPGTFMQNLLGLAAQVQAQGVLPVPAGDARVALIDARDVAAVAAHVLTTEGHEDAVYVVTGPEPLSYAEVAERMAPIAGQPVRYVDVPLEAWREQAVASGASEWVVDGYLELFAAIRSGAGEPVTDEVEKATGRPARTLEQFLADHRAAFAASVA